MARSGSRSFRKADRLGPVQIEIKHLPRSAAAWPNGFSFSHANRVMPSEADASHQSQSIHCDWAFRRQMYRTGSKSYARLLGAGFTSSFGIQRASSCFS